MHQLLMNQITAVASGQSLSFSTDTTNAIKTPPECPRMTATVVPSGFSGSPTYSWTYLSGSVPTNVSGTTTATVQFGTTGFGCTTGFAESGVYRCTAEFGITETAFVDVPWSIDSTGGSG